MMGAGVGAGVVGGAGVDGGTRISWYSNLMRLLLQLVYNTNLTFFLASPPRGCTHFPLSACMRWNRPSPSSCFSNWKLDPSHPSWYTNSTSFPTSPPFGCTHLPLLTSLR